MCDGCEALGAYPLSALELVAIFEEGRLVFSVVCYETMLVAQEESDLQGAVAVILPFDADNEVVRRANDTACRLAAYYHTHDVAAC